MKRVLALLAVVTFVLTQGLQASPHCEVPCGIYTDQLRIEMIKEHITTIEKAMIQIEELSEAEDINYNQLVRWINTKEHHANLIQEITEQYFMTQRVKPADPADTEAWDKYVTQITLLHEMLILSMKTKQTTDVAVTEKLLAKVDLFAEAYFAEKEHDHGHKH